MQVPQWKTAMDEEMQALVSHGTWELVNRPPGASVVSCKWVFIVKYKPDGSVDRYKARLVARGFTQVYGVDYAETFSRVGRTGDHHSALNVVPFLDHPSG